ncbi:MAG: hypothetical protein ABIG20_05370 [archaeon]
MAAPMSEMFNFLYMTKVPASFSLPITILLVYAVHLLVASSILYYAVRLSGAQLTPGTGFSKALTATFVRDILFIPLVLMGFLIPFFGLFIALVIWMGIVKLVFNISWARTVLAFLISIILPLVILLFILLPLFALLL